MTKGSSVILVFLTGLFFFSSCRTNQNKSLVNEEKKEIVANENIVHFKYGTFEGIIPCADCEERKQKLVLKENKVFILESTFLGKYTSVFKEKGTFSVQGEYLILSKEAPNKYAIVNGDLEQMDIEGKKIVSDLNYTLKRITTD